MKRTLLFLFFILPFLEGFSQEMMNSIPMALKNNRDVFQIVNEIKKETVLFISDRKKVTAFLLNEKMLVSDSISHDRPLKKYKDIVGYNGDESNPVIYWSSVDHTEIYSQFYDFKNHKISESAFEISLKGEEFLQYFQNGGMCYMLTIVKKSNILKLYTFEKNEPVSREIDLGELKLVDKNNKIHKFADALKDGVGYKDTFFKFWPTTLFNLEMIKPDIVIPLTVSAQKLKCYVKSNQLIITSDLNPAFTQLIEINLQDFKPKLRIYDQTEIAAENRNTNSFLIDDKLFQLTLYNTVIYLTVKDLEGNLISKNVAISSEPIPFKNADIVRQAKVGSKRILEKTYQLLQKINNERCAISVYKRDGNYLLTIGSVSEEQRGAHYSTVSINSSIKSGSLTSTTKFNSTFVYFNNSKNYFDAYVDRKVVYMNSIFNSEFSHIKGDMPELAFDKMKKFREEFYDIVANTVFKSGADYYFCYYNQTNKQYVIRQFTD